MFLQPGEEDFGIASVEAMSCGAPVVALRRGGVLDVVTDGATGVLYERPGAGPLAEAIRRADATGFDYTRMTSSARPFAVERFLREFRAEIEKLVPASS